MMLEVEVLRQAEMIAYSDAFLAAAMISLFGIPLALMFRDGKQADRQTGLNQCDPN